MPLIDDLLIQAQRDLAIREQQITAQLLRAYDVALARIQRELRTIEAQIAELIANGDTVNEQYLRRQRWWREVEASIQREMTQWTGQAANGIAALQSGGVYVGVNMAGQVAAAAGSPIQGRVYAEAFERWVSVLEPNSPLRTISLPRYAANVQAAIIERITEGIGGGKAPRAMVAEIMRDVGGVTNEARIMSLARTETMRSFRGASSDAYAKLPDGVITGYRWKATHDSRTCPACLALDGAITVTYPMRQHVNCRCVGIPVVSDDIVPGASRGGETGADWLAKQDAQTQRAVFPTEAHYDAYRAGVPLDSFVTVRRSPIWGDSVGVTPLRDLAR